MAAVASPAHIPAFDPADSSNTELDVISARHASLWAGLAALTALGCGGYPTPAPAPAQAPTAAGPTVSAAGLKTRLYVYSDDSMMGRRAGTEGDVKATDYIAAQVRQMGLVPAGDSGTYFQTIGMVNERFDTSSTMTVNGTALTLGKDFLFAGGQNVEAFKGGDVVYGGRLGDTSVHLAPDAVKGKVVVVGLPVDSAGHPTLRITGTDIAPFTKAHAVALASTLELLPPQAVAGMMQQERPALDEGDMGGAEAGLAFIVLGEHATELLLGGSLDSAALGPTGKSVTAHVVLDKRPVEFPARNVVAILPGSDPALKGEYVAIGAHNDHIGLTPRPLDHDSVWATNRVIRKGGMEDAPRMPTPEEAARIQALRDSLARIRPDRPDSVNNGADDDGSGTVSVLGIAQALAAMPVKPKRSILFVWHTGEELGMFGSTWFTDHPTVPRDSIVTQLNIDMIGRGDSADTPGGGPDYLQLIGSRRLSTELGDLVEHVNTADHHDFAFDYSFDANGDPHQYYCRSDHYEYARWGIPIAFFTTGGHPDYHQVTDEPQEIDYPKMARVASLIADIAVHVADLDHRPVVDHPKPDPHGSCVQ